MTEEFPLPGSSYKELIKIIQGYGRTGTEATLADVARLTAMNETVIIDICINNAIMGVQEEDTYAQAEGERRSIGRAPQARFGIAGFRALS